jgi:hypothetical protein
LFILLHFVFRECGYEYCLFFTKLNGETKRLLATLINYMTTKGIKSSDVADVG